jgi:hypothetical protein
VITRVLIVFAAFVAGVVVLVVLLNKSSNDKAAETGTALSWGSDPKLYGVEALPRDRVAIGRIVNGGDEPLTMSAGDFEVRDLEDREMDGRVQFVDARHPRPDSLGLGTEVELEPGERRPLTVSYRVEPRAVEPLTVFFKGASALPLPDGPVAPLTLDSESPGD